MTGPNPDGVVPDDVVPDDERLTAQVLGALSDAEAADLERALATDPVAHAARDGLRETVDSLSAALAAEAGPGLGVDRRAAILAAAPAIAAAVPVPRRARRVLRLPLVAVGCAAAVALAFGLTSRGGGGGERARVVLREFSPTESPIGFNGDGYPSNGSPGFGSPDPSLAPGPAADPVLVGPGRGTPRLRDAATVEDHFETDNDMPFEEPRFGDATENDLIGIGRDARGALPGHAWRARALREGALAAPQGTPPGSAATTSSEEGTEGFRTDDHDAIEEARFVRVLDEPLSTFSADVDTASYAIVRRYLQGGTLPPPGAVRIEEMVNYFRYGYEAPTDGDAPFAVRIDAAECPWNLKHRLVRIGVKAREIPERARPASNLVFLIDVSGSMASADKLPLVQRSLRLLVETLRSDDRVAIVVYAGASGLVLPPTSGAEKGAILAAIDRLSAGGSTNGASGIEQAYAEAQRAFVRGGTNRVILATDGDWNVGVTDRSSLVSLIEEKAKTGVFLTVLGFGMGNLKDGTLESLADKGNGNYGYVDSLAEAKRLLVEQAGGTLVTVAKDVKLQVEFNPARVAGYRLVGYENRRLAARDFNDDQKDAGEVGAGHEVTAFYEVVPVGGEVEGPPVDPLRYQPERAPASASAESLTVKVRAKRPDEATSSLWQFPFVDEGRSYAEASSEMKFAAAVATFGMLLRGSEHKGTATYEAVIELAGEGVGADPDGYRRELLDLVGKAKALAERPR